MDLIKRIDVPKGIAKNLALRENVFTLFICITQKIPIILTGEPGCGKTLSLSLILQDLHGELSNDNFFKFFPSIFPNVY